MCTKGISKCLLLLFNVGFLILGGVALGVGIFIIYDKDEVMDTLSRLPVAGESVEKAVKKASLLENSAYVLIAAGGLVFGISFLGFCGAIKSKKPLLYGYAICVGIVLLLEIVAGGLAYRYNSNLDKNFESFLEETIEKFYQGAVLDNGEIDAVKEVGKPVSEAWDFAQYEFECCGATNYSDFRNLPAKEWSGTYNYTEEDGSFTEITDAKVPISCCKVSKKDSKYPSKIEFRNLTQCLTTANEDYTNHKGCYKPLKNLYKRYTMILGGISIGVAIIEITGIIAACCLVRAIKKDEGTNV